MSVDEVQLRHEVAEKEYKEAFERVKKLEEERNALYSINPKTIASKEERIKLYEKRRNLDDALHYARRIAEQNKSVEDDEYGMYFIGRIWGFIKGLASAAVVFFIIVVIVQSCSQ